MSEADLSAKKPPRALPNNARAAMEALNAEAKPLHIWLRTQANSPSQRPWFREAGLDVAGQQASGRVAAGQLKTHAHIWRWNEISPYLHRIAEVAQKADIPPIEFADRQQFLLTNPGLSGRLQVTNTIRCAVSIYNPGDVAPVHVHTPNASRTILTETGGHTTVEGERILAARGDLILTPNGTWHDHGNHGKEPVIWLDVLDWPLLEFLDIIWLDEHFEGETEPGLRAQKVVHAPGHSQRLYGHGGLAPKFVESTRGFGERTSPMLIYRGADVREALAGLRGEAGDAYEGVILEFVNPVTGAAPFPTLGYSAQSLRPGERTRWKRETASTMYVALHGRGVTEVGSQRFEWRENDIFVVPNFTWRRHTNLGGVGDYDAILYAVSDQPLLRAIGQYRAQGRGEDDRVVNLPT